MYFPVLNNVRVSTEKLPKITASFAALHNMAKYLNDLEILQETHVDSLEYLGFETEEDCK